MKSELGFRPVHHQKEQRVDAHMFITLLAYHICHSIGHRLRTHGIRRHWETIRDVLSSHVRVTTTAKGEGNRSIHIRKNSRPTTEQRKIY